MKCLNCEENLIQIPKKRIKQFCDSTCRSNYWQKEKRKNTCRLPKDYIEIKNIKIYDPSKPFITKSGNLTSKSAGKSTTIKITEADKVRNTQNQQNVSETISEVDNSKILSMIEAVKLETKPYIISQTKFDAYKEKKIAELKKQLIGTV